VLIAHFAIAVAGPMSAESVYQITKSAFFLPERKVFCESYDLTTGKRSVELCFNWSVGVLHSALNALAENDAKFVSELRGFLSFAESYFNPAGPVEGFDVLPGLPFPNDRYYDDNAWVALAFADSSRILQDKRPLEWAKRARDFAYSGWDPILKGGIYWKEKEKSSKNTCSNAPTAAAILAIENIEPNDDAKRRAQEIFDWTNENLRDPEDGLFWDNIDLAGKIERTKWSYNTALMLRTAKSLYQRKPSPGLKQYVKDLESAAMKRWVRPDGTIDDELQFAHLLLENLDNKSLIDRCGSLENVRSSLLRGSENGYFGKRWGQRPSPQEPIQLIHQASAIRALAVLESRLRKER